MSKYSGLFTLQAQLQNAAAGTWSLPPGAPTIGTATATSFNSATVAFTAPTNTGGGPITSYTATSSPGGITASGATSPITVVGLTPSTSYTFTVTATNSFGTGPASAVSNSITTSAPPNIIATNLRVNLDAANYTSGSTWPDTSGNNLNATLVGSPSYTASSGSFFTFDGTSQYATTGVLSTAVASRTMQVWVNVTTPNKGLFVVNGRNSGFNDYGVGIGDGTNDGVGPWLTGLLGQLSWLPTTVAYTAGWQLVTMVLTDSSTDQIWMYINGTRVATFANPLATVIGGMVIAAQTDGSIFHRFYGGQIGRVLFYEAQLTDAQITQNYNAIRFRYGV